MVRPERGGAEGGRPVTQSPQLISAGGTHPGAGVHRFAHEAMGAVFEVFIGGQEHEYARQASAAAFEELDWLEGQLSRFRTTSDVSQVNALKAGRAVRVGLAAFECLEVAARVHADTGGAFDVTIGRLFDLWRPKDGSRPDPSDDEIARARARTGMHLLTLDETEHAVGVRADGVRVDLGGIGKGYAVDAMVTLLRDWSIETVLVHGGQSTVFGAGAPPGKDGWAVALKGPKGETLGTVCLKDQALSGSGSPPGQRHIIDPRTGRLAEGNLGAWAVTSKATPADALSTAFLVMSATEVEQYGRRHPEVSGMLLAADGKVVRFGKW